MILDFEIKSDLSVSPGPVVWTWVRYKTQFDWLNEIIHLGHTSYRMDE